MAEPDTGYLTEVLMSTTPRHLNDFFQMIAYQQEPLAFPSYFRRVLDAKGIKRSEAAAASGLEIHYAYQILSGVKPHPGRDKVICLCIGGRLTIQETQRVLERAEVNRLYPKRKRDAAIMLAINQRMWPVWKVNDLLAEYNLPLLG